MSLNNTPDSAEKLATNIDLVNLTNFISYTKNVENAGLGDYSKDVLVVIEAIRLLTEGLVYAFRVQDDYSERQGGNGDGVYLFKRIGLKSSINILSWENISGGMINMPTDLEAIKFLVQSGIKQVITGPIRGEFLGIESVSIDSDDGAALRIGVLTEKSISKFRENGIEITVLDRLV